MNWTECQRQGGSETAPATLPNWPSCPPFPPLDPHLVPPEIRLCKLCICLFEKCIISVQTGSYWPIRLQLSSMSSPCLVCHASAVPFAARHSALPRSPEAARASAWPKPRTKCPPSCRPGIPRCSECSARKIHDMPACPSICRYVEG